MNKKRKVQRNPAVSADPELEKLRRDFHREVSKPEVQAAMKREMAEFFKRHGPGAFAP